MFIYSFKVVKYSKKTKLLFYYENFLIIVKSSVGDNLEGLQYFEVDLAIINCLIFITKI